MPVKSSNMRTFREYKYVLAAVIFLAVLAAVRALNPAIFRYDAVKWAETSVAGENIISADRLASAGDDILLVRLDADCMAPEITGAAILAAAPGDLFSGDNIKKIRRNKGPVVLCSRDASVSARAWMILSETGIRNLYILKKDPA